MVTELKKLGEEFGSPLAKHAVEIEFEPGEGVIGAGPITGSISKAVVKYNDQEVTEVPEGEDFKVEVTYTAKNPGYALTPLDPGWSTSVTAISTGREVKGYNSTVELTESVSRVAGIGLGPMPSTNLSIRVKLWGTQDIWTAAGVPDTAPEAQW